MKRYVTLLTAMLVGLSAVALTVLPSMAQVAPTPIFVEELTRDGDGSVRGAFTDDVRAWIRVRVAGRRPQVLQLPDASRIAVAKLTVQPGAQFPWHTHHGPAMVSVVTGALVYVAADCTERTYEKGSAFIDPGRGNVHTAYNPTPGETVLIATFLEAPAAGPLTVPVGVQAPPRCAAGVRSPHDH
jgi:quercetin dioxygenase-like cupin family protein